MTPKEKKEFEKQLEKFRKTGAYYYDETDRDLKFDDNKTKESYARFKKALKPGKP